MNTINYRKENEPWNCIHKTSIQKMLSTRYVPHDFKFSYIVPIPKPKDYYSKPLKCDDFRGIAISPILSKVFEYCLLDKFNRFLKTSDTQFGFKKGLGCNHAIFSVRTIVESFVRKGNTVNLCAIDLSKAFDKVNLHEFTPFLSS